MKEREKKIEAVIVWCSSAVSMLSVWKVYVIKCPAKFAYSIAVANINFLFLEVA